MGGQVLPLPQRAGAHAAVVDYTPSIVFGTTVGLLFIDDIGQDLKDNYGPWQDIE